MKRKGTLLICSLLIGFLALPPMLQAEPSDETPSAELIENRELGIRCDYKPDFPMRAKSTGILKGAVNLIIQVDGKGKLLDAMVEKSSHECFEDIALKTLRKATFTPAYSHGKPIMVRQPVNLNFESGQSTVQVSVMDHVASLFNHTHGTQRIYTLPEIDQRPKSKHIVPPELDAVPEETRVVVDFYIDAKGRTRMPVAAKGNYLPAIEAAISAVRQWEFEPARRKGQTVAIRTQMPFVFKLKETSAESETTQD